MPAWLAPLAAGAASLAGGALANRARRKEGRRNRQFQERMRNTAWQAAVADMEQAGINPALAYSQGPAASPGGSMAQQMDALSPGISSAMQAARMREDLKIVKAQREKVEQEGRGAAAAASLAEGRLAAYGITQVDIDGRKSLKFETEPGKMPWIARDVQSQIKRSEEQARREGATADTLRPLADLSNRLGEWLPILLGAGAMMSPGGAVTRSGAGVAKMMRRRRAIKVAGGR